MEYKSVLTYRVPFSKCPKMIFFLCVRLLHACVEGRKREKEGIYEADKWALAPGWLEGDEKLFEKRRITAAIGKNHVLRGVKRI